MPGRRAAARCPAVWAVAGYPSHTHAPCLAELLPQQPDGGRAAHASVQGEAAGAASAAPAAAAAGDARGRSGAPATTGKRAAKRLASQQHKLGQEYAGYYTLRSDYDPVRAVGRERGGVGRKTRGEGLKTQRAGQGATATEIHERGSLGETLTPSFTCLSFPCACTAHKLSLPPLNLSLSPLFLTLRP